MEEITFKIEWCELARVWAVSRDICGHWVMFDTRMLRSWALRLCRKKAGPGAQMVLTKISDHNRLTIVTYRRLT
jgi:hypothetical protein